MTPREARAVAVRFARQHIANEEKLSSIALCVTQAVANVVLHAYRDDEPGPAILECEFDGQAVWISVCDHGSGLAPRLDSPGLGLGGPLIAQTAAEVGLAGGPHGGTEIRMRFDVESG